jgi:hypothetical protein
VARMAQHFQTVRAPVAGHSESLWPDVSRSWAEAKRLAWELPRPDKRRDPPGIADALRRLHEADPHARAEHYSPPVSVLPITRAAREALRFSRI